MDFIKDLKEKVTNLMFFYMTKRNLENKKTMK